MHAIPRKKKDFSTISGNSIGETLLWGVAPTGGFSPGAGVRRGGIDVGRYSDACRRRNPDDLRLNVSRNLRNDRNNILTSRCAELMKGATGRGSLTRGR